MEREVIMQRILGGLDRWKTVKESKSMKWKFSGHIKTQTMRKEVSGWFRGEVCSKLTRAEFTRISYRVSRSSKPR